MTQQILANKANKSKSLISKIISRKIYPSIETAVLLAKITNPHITAEQWGSATPAKMRRLWIDYKQHCRVQTLKELS